MSELRKAKDTETSELRKHVAELEAEECGSDEVKKCADKLAAAETRLSAVEMEPDTEGMSEGDGRA
jgi:exonuclease VII small subunit